MPLTAADNLSDFNSSAGFALYYGDCEGRGPLHTAGCTLPLKITTVLYSPHSDASFGPSTVRTCAACRPSSTTAATTSRSTPTARRSTSPPTHRAARSPRPARSSRSTAPRPRTSRPSRSPTSSRACRPSSSHLAGRPGADRRHRRDQRHRAAGRARADSGAGDLTCSRPARLAAVAFLSAASDGSATILLRARHPPAGPALTPGRARGSGPDRMSERPKILVVDDEPAVQQALSRAFALERYERRGRAATAARRSRRSPRRASTRSSSTSRCPASPGSRSAGACAPAATAARC